jgi:hypothetical protein
VREMRLTFRGAGILKMRTGLLESWDPTRLKRILSESHQPSYIGTCSTTNCGALEGVSNPAEVSGVTRGNVGCRVRDIVRPDSRRWRALEVQNPAPAAG